MSELNNKIQEDQKKALREKNEIALSTLRMLSAAIKNKRIEQQKDLSDEEIQKVVKSLVKQRKDSIESYKSGGRAELAEKEEKEIEVLKEYLSEEMPEEEIEKIVDEAIADIGASGIADMGKVMGPVMGKISGRADGNKVNEIVKQKLS